MKTTLDLPATLLKKVEQAAAAHGTTPEQFIVETLEKNLSTRAPSAAERVMLPIIPSKQPGVLRLTNADIEELLA